MIDVTVANAPRDLEELKKVTAFALRKLADELGGLNDAKLKWAWGSMNVNERAQAVFTLLQQHDASGSGVTAAAAAAMAQAPPAPVVRHPVTNGAQQLPLAPPPQVAQVSDAAAAVAAGATAERPAGRKPKTDAGLGADVVDLLRRISDALEKDAERFPQLAESITTLMREASSDKVGRVAKLEERLSSIEGTLAYQRRIMLAGFWLQLEVAAVSLGGNANELLTVALAESESLRQMINEFASGK